MGPRASRSYGPRSPRPARLFENESGSDQTNFTAGGAPATATPCSSTGVNNGADNYHDRWWAMKTGLAAGTYELQVQTTNPGNASINANTNAENMWSLAVTGGGGPRVYGAGRMATYNNLNSGLQKFYLAQIDAATGAGKTAEIDLFDPGDVGGNAFLRILSPDGGSQSYATFSYTSDSNCVSGASDLCQRPAGTTQIQTGERRLVELQQHVAPHLHPAARHVWQRRYRGSVEQRLVADRVQREWRQRHDDLAGLGHRQPGPPGRPLTFGAAAAGRARGPGDLPALELAHAAARRAAVTHSERSAPERRRAVRARPARPLVTARDR